MQNSTLSKLVIKNCYSCSSAIILNGQECELPAHFFSLYEQILIVDGAWNRFVRSVEKSEIERYRDKIIVLGDGDSIISRPSHFIETPDQNYTDFEKALQYANAHTMKEFDVFWADGGDADHFLANLSVAAKYSATIQLYFYNSSQYYFFVSSNRYSQVQINKLKNNIISIYPFHRVIISSQGLQYPLQKMTMTQNTQQSLRNQAIDDNVLLELHEGDCWVFVRY